MNTQDFINIGLWILGIYAAFRVGAWAYWLGYGKHTPRNVVEPIHTLSTGETRPQDYRHIKMRPQSYISNACVTSYNVAGVREDITDHLTI